MAIFQVGVCSQLCVCVCGGVARFYKDVNASTPFSIRLMVFIEHLLVPAMMLTTFPLTQGERGSPFSSFSPLDSMRIRW